MCFREQAPGRMPKHQRNDGPKLIARSPCDHVIADAVALAGAQAFGQFACPAQPSPINRRERVRTSFAIRARQQVQKRLQRIGAVVPGPERASQLSVVGHEVVSDRRCLGGPAFLQTRVEANKIVCDKLPRIGLASNAWPSGPKPLRMEGCGTSIGCFGQSADG